jgi:integrase
MHDSTEKLGQIGEYWLSKRTGSGQYCRTWYCPESRQTKRASLGTSDLQAAKLALYEWFSRHGIIAEQSPDNTPAELIFAQYYNQYAVKLASEETARIALGYWSDYFAGSMVSEISPVKQKAFVKWLNKDKPRSDGYIKRILSVGKSAFMWAFKEGMLTSVPYIITWADGIPRDRVLTVDESRALLAAAKQPHERMFIALMFGLAARPEAVLDLNRESVDFERRLIAQNAPGRKQTRKHRPTVPVPDFLLPMLAEAGPGALVQYRGQPIDSIKSAFRRMRRDAGLGQDVVAKTIRHTVATFMRSQGVPEAEIQGYLGHKAYGGKTEIYAKYRPDYLGAARVALDKYWEIIA